MRSINRFSLWGLGAALALAGCEAQPIGPPPAEGFPDDASMEDGIDESQSAAFRGLDPALRVYTQNVYVGADVDAVIAAGASGDQQLFVQTLVQALQTFDATDWPARAARIADEIAHQRPQVIGLNEISTVERRGFQLIGLPLADQRTEFLPVLLKALSQRGLRYRIAGAVQNVNVTIPLLIDKGQPVAFVSLTDYDVMLVEQGLRTSNVVAKNYQTYLPVNLGGLDLAILRGYVAADVQVGSQTYRFVTTHPEPRQPVPQIQQAQIAELLGDLSGVTLPIVALGDFNSEPTDPAGYANDQMTRAGFADAWLGRLGLPQLTGATCCHASDLRDNAALTQRIDYVWVKPAGGLLGPVRMKVFGDDAWERTASGLWPSDHAGLIARLRIIAPRGH
jgi:endonuclease/exonuclease/phosphatase family metal-dependent hydrolase